MFFLVCSPGGGRLPASLAFLREFGKAMFGHWLLAERATGALGTSHAARSLSDVIDVVLWP